MVVDGRDVRQTVDEGDSGQRLMRDGEYRDGTARSRGGRDNLS